MLEAYLNVAHLAGRALPQSQLLDLAVKHTSSFQRSIYIDEKHYKIWEQIYILKFEFFCKMVTKLAKKLGIPILCLLFSFRNSYCWVVTILKKNYNKSHFVDQICDSTASRVQHKILWPVL